MIKRIHHIALITDDLDRSLHFYSTILGFRVLSKYFRADRNSWKVDLKLGDIQLELFTFPDAPARPSWPEARGLRHLAFEVEDLQKCHAELLQNNWDAEVIRRDDLTGKNFFFSFDPDGTPIEFYES